MATSAVMRPWRTMSASDCSMVIIPALRLVEICVVDLVIFAFADQVADALWKPSGSLQRDSAARSSSELTAARRLRAGPATIAGGSETDSKTGTRSRILDTACDVSLVWSVESTRCPVSAAVSTVEIVSGSRISPPGLRPDSGAECCGRNCAKSGASGPTSICSMTELRFAWTYSTGSSMVTT